MLRFGVFDGFKGGKTLLFWGQDEGLTRLALLLGEFAEGAKSEVTLDREAWVESVHGNALVLKLADATDLSAQSSLTIVASRSGFERAAELALSLVGPSCLAGHQYLEDALGAPMQVIVSKGEYPEDFAVGPATVLQASVRQT